MDGKRKGFIKVSKKPNNPEELAATNLCVPLPIKSTASTSQDDVLLDAPINKLNDDCLREIFSHLSKRQLIGIERVCKRWKEVALSLWSSETSLTYEQIQDITQDFEKINIQHFESVLTRCKNHLTSLDLNQRGLYFPEESDANTIIFLIFTLLKNLKHLIVNGGLFTKTVLHWLEKEKSFCPNLESFKITHCSALSDEILEMLLIKAPKLQSLDIGGNSHLYGDGLAKSKRPFKLLDISFCKRISAENLNKIFDNSPELEEFKGVRTCTFSMLNERPLREHIVVIQTFGSRFFQDIPKYPSPFSKLRTLRLSCDYSVNNKVLAEFYKWFPNLEILELSECTPGEEDHQIELNNGGIKELAKVSKLKSLDFFSLIWLSGDALIHLASNTNGRIEVMECADCHEVYDPEMIKFVSLCPKLKYLNVSYCPNITDDFLDGVLNSMHLRTLEEPLKIRVTDDICHVSKFIGRHPLLKIEPFGEFKRDIILHGDDYDDYGDQDYDIDDENDVMYDNDYDCDYECF